MTSTDTKLKWDDFYRNVFSWWNQGRNGQPTKADHAYERSISILQKRYGYSREEAESQLSQHYSKAWLG